MKDIPYLLLSTFVILKLIDLGRVGFISLVRLKINLGSKNRRITDASYLESTPPPVTQQVINSLKRLNFQRLGEAQLKLPFQPIATTWVLIDTSDQVQAETAGGRVSFSSFFRDNILVVTDYPNGEHINTPTYQSHTITTDIYSAYLYHLKQVEKFGRKYGWPNSIRSMADYYRYETMGRIYYGSLKLKRFIWLGILRLAIFVFGLFALILEFLSGWGQSSKVAIFTLLILFIPDILEDWMIKRTYRNSAER